VPRSTTHEFEEAAQKCFSEELAAAMHRRLEVDVCKRTLTRANLQVETPGFPGGGNGKIADRSKRKSPT